MLTKVFTEHNSCALLLLQQLEMTGRRYLHGSASTPHGLPSEFCPRSVQIQTPMSRTGYSSNNMTSIVEIYMDLPHIMSNGGCGEPNDRPALFSLWRAL